MRTDLRFSCARSARSPATPRASRDSRRAARRSIATACSSVHRSRYAASDATHTAPSQLPVTMVLRRTAQHDTGPSWCRNVNDCGPGAGLAARQGAAIRDSTSE